MKKFILVLLFIASLLSAQEIIQIGDFDLEIPKDYFDLKNAYIIMANLYIESDEALAKSNQNFKDLKIEYDKIVMLLQESEVDNEKLVSLINDELLPNIENLENQIDILMKELKKWIKPDLLQLYTGGSFSNELLIPNTHIGGFINLVIYEQYSIKAEYLFLDQYSVSIGYRIF